MRSATIVTCSPNELVAELHDRMPVILPPSAWPAWLGEESVKVADADTLAEFEPYSAICRMHWRFLSRSVFLDTPAGSYSSTAITA